MTRNRTGITLIETLAALALLALVSPVATRAWLIAMEVSHRGRDITTASMLASNQLQELILEGSVSSDEGDFGDDYPNYRWELAASTWDKNNSMQQLDLTVIWTRGHNEEFTYQVTTLVQTSTE